MCPAQAAGPLRWVSWAAVSSQPQAAADKISIPEQLRLNAEHAAKHGGEVVKELVVPGESRSIDTWEEACQRIDAYAQLRDMLESNAFDVLVYHDASRLARTLSLGATIRQLCVRRNIVLYQTTAPPNELRAGWRHDQALVDAIQSVGAQEEVARFVERNRVGMVGRIQRGEFGRGPIYGYVERYDPDGTRRILINPEAAAVVREIVRLYLDGSGLESIGLILHERGYRSPLGNRWGEGGVRTILDNAWKYAGYAELNRGGKHRRQLVRAPARWEPIISEETARNIEDERNARKQNRRLPNPVDRLSGVCICAECGGTMHIQMAIRRWGDVERTYTYCRCIRHAPNTVVRTDVVLGALHAEIASLHDADLADLAGDEPDTLGPLRAQVRDVENARERLNAALRRADDAYVNGVMDEERYKAQVERIKNQLAAAESDAQRVHAQMADAEERGTRQRRLTDVRDYGAAMLDNPDVQASNLWLRRHVRVYCVHRGVAAVQWL